MAKRQPKKKIEKKEFELSAFKKENNLNHNVNDKPLTWIPMSKAFHEALNIPGVPRGYFTSFRGFTNTGKSTAMYEIAAGCNKIGDLPVIIQTEGHWDWEHAKLVGMECEEYTDENGNIDWGGDFLYFNGHNLVEMFSKIDYSDGTEKKEPIRDVPVIEDVARLMNFLLDKQANGDLPRNLCFLWDSVGSLDSFKSVTSKVSNNMWNAGAMEIAFKSLVNHRIPSSKNYDKEFTNTLCVVQKIWLDNMHGGVVKHKGGESFAYSPRLVIHLGGVLSPATQTMHASAGGKKYSYGIKTKIEIKKNHVNGIAEQGKQIASTVHGYINPDDKNEYTKKHKDFFIEKLNASPDDDIILSEEDYVGMDEKDLSSVEGMGVVN